MQEIIGRNEVQAFQDNIPTMCQLVRRLLKLTKDKNTSKWKECSKRFLQEEFFLLWIIRCAGSDSIDIMFFLSKT